MSELALALGLPASVVAAQENTPLEDVGLAVLREALPGVPFFSKIPYLFDGESIEPHDVFAVLRRINSLGLWEGRHGLLDSGSLAVHVFARDPDGELKAALVSEAVRVAFENAADGNWYKRGVGALSDVRLDEEPNRKTDFATSAGPVQYADLPTGYWRYETRYMLWVRPPSVWA